MIPKNLISCWFGRGERSDLFKHCTATKRKILSEWNVIEINEDTIDPGLLASPYMQSCIERKQWVKCTELGRLWGLSRHGGVYMDEDVEALKPLDPLLGVPFFIGYEDGTTLNGAVMGSVPGGETIKTLLEGFPIAGDASLKATHYGPLYLTKALAGSDVTKHPPEAFYPYKWDQDFSYAIVTDKTYAAHHWAGSWKGYT